jgi:hypothetical protein
MGLIEEIIGKFNENKIMMEKWKKSTVEILKMGEKKKKEKFKREDIYEVT